MGHLTWDYFRRRIDLNDTAMPSFLAKNDITTFGGLAKYLKGRGVLPPLEEEVAVFFEPKPPPVKKKPVKQKPKPPVSARVKSRRPRSTRAKLGEKARKEATDSKSGTSSKG